MLKKSIGLTAAALALGVFGIMGNGCSSSSSLVAAGGGDSGPGKDSGVIKDSGPTPDGGGPTCYDTTGEFTYIFGAPVAHQNVCSAS
ncbi:MAG: hypothetical protein ACRELY_04605, partial [Polyangiaceae bacterium]